MENVFILDTETTGLDHNSDKLIEIAGIFYNVRTKSVLHQVSTLLYADDNQAYDINKIPVDSLKAVKSGIAVMASNLFFELMLRADAVIAHNAPFDKQWLDNNKFDIPDKRWICTKEDFTWPIRKGTPLNLIHIAVDMGVPVTSAHRALTDCALIAECFNRVDNLAERLNEALEEKSLYTAHVSFEDRQLAKDEGFSWNADKRSWEKKMTDKQFEATKASAKFMMSKKPDDKK